jgi:uncharacterized integral membrane protein
MAAAGAGPVISRRAGSRRIHEGWGGSVAAPRDVCYTVLVVRLIVTLILLVILAVFIGLNIPYRTTVDIFGWRLEDAPSIIVIFASLALGIVLSLAVYVSANLAKRRTKSLRARVTAAQERELELAKREKAADQGADAGTERPALPAEAGVPSPETPPPKRAAGGLRARLRRTRRS